MADIWTLLPDGIHAKHSSGQKRRITQIQDQINEGRIELVEYVAPKPDEDEALSNECRAWRNLELEYADIQIKKIEDKEENASHWRAYRIELRNYPQDKKFPHNEKPKRPLEV